MRTIIVGGPRCGKSTLAATLGAPVYCGDPRSKVKQPLTGVEYLPEGLPFAGDSGSSAWIGRNWFAMPGPWTLEGHVMARALRRWARTHQGMPCDRIIVLREPHPAAEVSSGQRAMGVGVLTVWDEIAHRFAGIIEERSAEPSVSEPLAFTERRTKAKPTASTLDALFASIDSRIDEPFRWHETETEQEWWALEVERRHRRLDRFAAIEDDERRALALQLEWELCAADPDHFVEQYVWIQDPHRMPVEMREMPFVLWDAQKEFGSRLTKCFAEPKGSMMADIVVIKGRELGVSWYVQARLLHRFIFESSSSSFCMSQKEKKVDDRTPNSLFGKFRYMLDRLPGFLRPRLVRDAHMQLESADGSTIGGDSTQGSALRGFRGGTIFLDEFPAVEARMQESVWLSTESVAHSRIVVGTSNGPANLFAKLVNGDARDGVASHPNVMVMDWRCNPSRTEEWAAAKRDSMGVKQFDQEHGAKIVTLAAGAIWVCRKSLVRYGEADSVRAFDPKWYKTQPIVSGWDFGSGPSLLVCINAIVEHTSSGKFRLWIDSELVWSRTQWVTAAADAVKRVREYGSRDWTCYGDPSGANPESDLESWETNLRAGGVPMFCLPHEVHADSEATEWSIRKVQGMIDNDRLRIHDRCQYVWSCIDNWARAAPNGADLNYISRAYIAPKHDVYSHGGKALLYLIEGALRQDETRRAQTLANRSSMIEALNLANRQPLVSTIQDMRKVR